MTHRPQNIHCERCLSRTNHNVHRQRVDAHTVQVSATCLQCGARNRDRHESARYDPRHDPRHRNFYPNDADLHVHG